MRGVFALVVVVHALLHLLGFVQARWPQRLPQLTGATTFELPAALGRLLGPAWLLAAVAMVVTAALWFAQREPWWIVGGFALVLSQALVIHAWPDAKFGTVANVLLALAVVVGFAQARFRRDSAAEVALLWQHLEPGPAAIVQEAELEPLPAPVQRWLRQAGVVGRPRVRSVRLRQRGELRTSPQAAYMPATVEQYFAVDEPGFVWQVQTAVLGVVPVVGRDQHLGGRGRMLITLGGLVPVVDAADAAIDEATLQRFLGEIAWFPSAALAPWLSWRAIDDERAEATVRWAGLTTNAIFHVDAGGHLVRLEALRYLGGGAEARRERWAIPMTQWRRFDGIEVPSHGDAVWQLESGDFSYYRWEIEHIDYDRPTLF